MPKFAQKVLLLMLVCIVSGFKMTFSQESPEATFVIPSGSKFIFVLRDAIDSDSAQEGDEIFGHPSESILLQGKVCVPKEALITGCIRYHRPRLGRYAAMTIAFSRVEMPNGQILPLFAHIEHRNIVSLERSGHQVIYDTGSKKTVGNTFVRVPSEEDPSSNNETTLFGSRVGEPIKLEANDEFTLELSKPLRD